MSAEAVGETLRTRDCVLGLRLADWTKSKSMAAAQATGKGRNRGAERTAKAAELGENLT